MAIDMDKLAGLMAQFEAGGDMPGPFAPESLDDLIELLPLTEPWLEGGAVPDTKRHLNPNHHNEDALAFATAGFLQGLALGCAYAAEEES